MTSVGVVLEIVDVSCNSVTVLSQFPLVEDIFNVGLVVCIGDVVGGVLDDVVVGGCLEVHEMIDLVSIVDNMSKNVVVSSNIVFFVKMGFGGSVLVVVVVDNVMLNITMDIFCSGVGNVDVCFD